MLNPKPGTSASHLPSPTVIPVSLRGNFHRVSQIRSTVEREALIACGHIRDNRKPSIAPSDSKSSISSGSSDVDERTPLLPSRRDPPTARPGVKTELIPFAMAVKAAYKWLKRTKNTGDFGVHNQTPCRPELNEVRPEYTPGPLFEY